MSKRKNRSRRRSRGMGGISIDFTNLIGVVVGAVGSKLIDKIIPKGINQKISSAGKIALGLALPMFVKGGNAKNMLSGVGAGMIAVGSIELLNSFGVLAGLGNKDDDMLLVSLEGADDLNVINGADDLNVINGALGEDVLAEDVLAESEVEALEGYDDED